jgi:LmbE family N-acetylglucosaminyl deacetylase
VSDAIVFAPHGDDEALFAAYTCMRERAHVIICSQDADPEIRRARSLETTSAITILGCSHHEWQMSAAEMDWEQARAWMEPWNSTRLVASLPDRIYAPAIHPEGHQQHNRIGELALEVFGDKVIPYTTYAPRAVRQIGAKEIVPTTDEIVRKLRAIACYRTQIENPSTRPWFYDLLDLREWHD